EVEGEPGRIGDYFSALLSEDSTDAARGRVLRCDEDVIAVSWSWQSEPERILTARITPVDEHATELTLQHVLTQPDHAVGYGGGWEQMLQALARSLGATDDDAAEGQIETDALARWGTIARSALELETFIRASPAQVWRAFATADGLRSWWWRHWSDVRIE